MKNKLILASLLVFLATTVFAQVVMDYKRPEESKPREQRKSITELVKITVVRTNESDKPLLVKEVIKNNDIKVAIEGLRNNEGSVRVGIFDYEDGFPETIKKASRVIVSTIKDKKAQVSFSNTPIGDYAIVVLHDENNNGQRDSSFFGFIKEGMGVSNNARGLWRSPSFDAAKFNLGAHPQDLKIKINY